MDYSAKHPAVRVLDGRFAAVQQAVGVRKGKDTADAWLRAFIEELERSGFVARSIDANQAKGLTIPN